MNCPYTFSHFDWINRLLSREDYRPQASYPVHCLAPKWSVLAALLFESRPEWPLVDDWDHALRVAIKYYCDPHASILGLWQLVMRCHDYLRTRDVKDGPERMVIRHLNALECLMDCRL